MIVTTSLLVQSYCSSSVCVSLQLYSLRILVFIDSCKEPIEPLSIEEVAERCHAPEDLEVIYKIIAHMAANERALIAEGLVFMVRILNNSLLGLRKMFVLQPLCLQLWFHVLPVNDLKLLLNSICAAIDVHHCRWSHLPLFLTPTTNL
ncbi:uncharacterized protein LOC131660816 isoform X2 [Vicia villosa]|uniref:uncharacterized protein LOC131660816 isoform X2 n=1 Tax=Vicia villosa TaxID=3911 RepID=UPI00273BDCE4|nr:uncharacterized protein LOC131660816 isoform X2 [Vicia villosa]